MEETKIKGLKIIFTEDCMTIKDSYQIKNVEKIRNILMEALKKTTIYNTSRSIKSLTREWIGHNFLYRIHLFRKHTKDSDFEKKIFKGTSFCYFLLSFFPLLFFYIKIINKKIKRKIKEKQYKYYIYKHKKNVEKAFFELKKNKKFYAIGDQELLNKLFERVSVHDDSKFSQKEFDYYRKNFYPIDKQEKEENKKDFEKAWEHHYKNNTHHWENRQFKKTFNINNEEEVLDVLENVLDWMAMGYKFKNRPFQYYEKNKKNIILPEMEKHFLEHIIYDIVDADFIKKEELLKWKKEKKKKNKLL